MADGCHHATRITHRGRRPPKSQTCARRKIGILDGNVLGLANVAKPTHCRFTTLRTRLYVPEESADPSLCAVPGSKGQTPQECRAVSPADQRLSDREVWFSASEILTEYGPGAIAYIIDQVSCAIADETAVEDWRRVATAVDAIIDCREQ